MVELFEQNFKKNERQSSKGNQLKWENEGIWYKADYTGYEGLSEYIISHLLQKSTLSKKEFALYHPETIKYKTTTYLGVRSDNFLEDGWQLITLERLFKNVFGKSLQKSIFQIANHESRMRFMVEQVERMTGLKGFGCYLNKLLAIDALFLNEDRHTHNIAVLMNEVGEFAYCPIFDNGAGLLADTKMDYPLGEDIFALIEQVQPKTISTDFDDQLDISKKLYGCNLKFYFTKQDVRTLLDQAEDYPLEERHRVEKIIYEQMRKYKYLFSECK